MPADKLLTFWPDKTDLAFFGSPQSLRIHIPCGLDCNFSLLLFFLTWTQVSNANWYPYLDWPGKVALSITLPQLVNGNAMFPSAQAKSPRIINLGICKIAWNTTTSNHLQCYHLGLNHHYRLSSWLWQQPAKVSLTSPWSPYSLFSRNSVKFKSHHITPLLKTFCWLPISSRIKPKSLQQLTKPDMMMRCPYHLSDLLSCTFSSQSFPATLASLLFPHTSTVLPPDFCTCSLCLERSSPRYLHDLLPSPSRLYLNIPFWPSYWKPWWHSS